MTRKSLFKYPGHLIKSTIALAPGIDVRADFSYIVAPPSNHVSGKKYGWDVDRHPEEVLVAPLPGWLLDLLTKQRNEVSKRDWQKIFRSSAIDGTRNNTIASLSGEIDPQMTHATA